MEETWKAIGLSPLGRSAATVTEKSSFNGLELLDLFSIPSHKDNSTTPRAYDHHPPSTRSQGGAAVNGSPPSPPPFTTVVSDRIHSSPSPPYVSSMEFCVLPCSSVVFPSQNSKRKAVLEDDDDTRFKRLMKCREAGNRSRGRAQAYMEELQKEQRQLKKENAKIRRELQKIDEICRTTTHFRVRRSSTAPL